MIFLHGPQSLGLQITIIREGIISMAHIPELDKIKRFSQNYLITK